MLRFRSLAVLFVATGLAVMPVLRSACDLDCADPLARPPSAKTAEAHCPQHPGGGAPAQPARDGDGCGHDHQAHRSVAARKIKYEASVTSTLIPPAATVAADPVIVAFVRLSSSPPHVRTSAASAPLRI